MTEYFRRDVNSLVRFEVPRHRFANRNAVTLQQGYCGMQRSIEAARSRDGKCEFGPAVLLVAPGGPKMH